mmetsp:Transcript_4944/g.20164  ORF Transcript_4944/g.20164 Transcript_4944/m.20164 type:complete len:361 (+) Transcript_4944:511-1593(+)
MRLRSTRNVGAIALHAAYAAVKARSLAALVIGLGGFAGVVNAGPPSLSFVRLDPESRRSSLRSLRRSIIDPSPPEVFETVSRRFRGAESNAFAASAARRERIPSPTPAATTHGSMSRFTTAASSSDGSWRRWRAAVTARWGVVHRHASRKAFAPAVVRAPRSPTHRLFGSTRRRSSSSWSSSWSSSPAPAPTPASGRYSATSSSPTSPLRTNGRALAHPGSARDRVGSLRRFGVETFSSPFSPSAFSSPSSSAFSDDAIAAVAPSTLASRLARSAPPRARKARTVPRGFGVGRSVGVPGGDGTRGGTRSRERERGDGVGNGDLVPFAFGVSSRDGSCLRFFCSRRSRPSTGAPEGGCASM